MRKIPIRYTREEAHAVTIGDIPSLERFQAHPDGKSWYNAANCERQGLKNIRCDRSAKKAGPSDDQIAPVLISLQTEGPANKHRPLSLAVCQYRLPDDGDSVVQEHCVSCNA
jgi:hypothetical protein